VSSYGSSRAHRSDGVVSVFANAALAA
jgi:hypothetical protein